MNRRPKFLLEHSLLGLARLLRFAGFDARVYRAWSLGRIESILTKENRTLLWLGQKRVVANFQPYRLKKVGKWSWFAQVVCDFGIEQLDFGRRCPECNTELAEADAQKVAQRLPKEILARYDEFKVCFGCGRIYWAGGQFRALRAKMEVVIENNKERLAKGNLC